MLVWKAAGVVLAAVLAWLAVPLLHFVKEALRIHRTLLAVPAQQNAPGVVNQLLAPLLGPVWELYWGCPWEIMKGWVQQRMPLVRIRIVWRQCVIVGSPEGLKRVFQTKQRLYEKDLGWSYFPFLPILGTGLVTSDGRLWQQQRVLLGPALRMEILDDVVRIAKDAVDRLSAKLQAVRGTGQAVDMNEELRLLTLQVIGEAMLSLPPEECDKVFPELYLPVMEESNLRVLRPWRHYLPGPAWYQFNVRMHKLNSYICGILRTRWQAHVQGAVPAKPDVLDRILTALQERGQTWSKALETQLCYEIKTFLLAGHETSAAMLTWTLFELTQYPDGLAQVQHEAQAVFGVHEAEPSRDAVEGMVYSLSALKESLRKYTVVPVVVRHLSADDELCGYTVPRGTYVICQLQSVHGLWKQPESWQPERFMPKGEYDSFEEDIRPYMFVPFVQGPRNCLGQYFALLEARVVLGLLVKRFRFRTAGANAGVTHPTVIPVGPADGMRMLVD